VQISFRFENFNVNEIERASYLTIATSPFEIKVIHIPIYTHEEAFEIYWELLEFFIGPSPHIFQRVSTGDKQGGSIVTFSNYEFMIDKLHHLCHMHVHLD
jgi:hypothetical protein